MSNKVYYTNNDVGHYVNQILQGLAHDNWRPDYIVGLTRGGLIPAVMISHYLGVPLHTLNASLRDSKLGPESNLWMAEDAFGYADGSCHVNKRHNILIVDDINDQGTTLNWVKQDWQSGCLPNDSAWEDIWGANVRTAVLINNAASEFKTVNYIGKTINKEEVPEWCVFPWENWWE
jgi:hypoxanthine phosphoribosyltransferase